MEDLINFEKGRVLPVEMWLALSLGAQYLVTYNVYYVKRKVMLEMFISHVRH